MTVHRPIGFCEQLKSALRYTFSMTCPPFPWIDYNRDAAIKTLAQEQVLKDAFQYAKENNKKVHVINSILSAYVL